MKIKSYYIFSLVVIFFFIASCKDDDSEDLSVNINKTGIEEFVDEAYQYLQPHEYDFVDPNNLAFGSVSGGDARLLSDAGVQGWSYQFDNFQVTSSNEDLIRKWQVCYEGIHHCNNGIDTIGRAVLTIEVDETFKSTKIAELRFLRSFLYFELVKVFGPEIPFYDENTPDDHTPVVDHPVWQDIETDLTFAADNLPASWGAGEEGRANLWAAKAFLAKAKLFQAGNETGKYAEALTLLEDIMENGLTGKGEKYSLLTNFDDNFNVVFDNNSESVFAEQSKVDGSDRHGNFGYVLAYPYANPDYDYSGDIPGGCCGFFSPTFSLVNSYKVDPDGLPFLDGSYNDTDLQNDMGLEPDAVYEADATTAVDPRVDWTVGRRGIPYLNWGLHPGKSWIRDQGYSGPYSPIKNVYRKNDPTELQDGWATGSGLNTPLMRYADLLLMAAECYAQAGATQDLVKATQLVNQIRTRAGNHSVPGSVANYEIGIYPAFTSGDAAIQAIRFERKLELAMEGHRYFDLVRWGIAQYELEALIVHEHAAGCIQYGYISGDILSTFFPIPIQN